MRNIDFDVKIVQVPEKIGDILEISWSFTLNRETDSIFRGFCEREDSLSRIKAYFNIRPDQEYLSGDVEWIGDIEYGKKHSFSFKYKIKTSGKITGSPIVEIQKDVNGKWLRSTSNGRKGFMFIIKDTVVVISPQEFIEVIGEDTIKYITNIELPPELCSMNKQVVYGFNTEENKEHPPVYSKLLNLEKIKNNDTVDVIIRNNSIIRIYFSRIKPDFYEINNQSEAKLIEKTANGFQLSIDDKMQSGMVVLTIDDSKNVYIRPMRK